MALETKRFGGQAYAREAYGLGRLLVTERAQVIAFDWKRKVAPPLRANIYIVIAVPEASNLAEYRLPAWRRAAVEKSMTHAAVSHKRKPVCRYRMHLWRGPVADETCGVPHFGLHLPLACGNFLERLMAIGA
jgi:hypothetical protein